jgi:hypothetical protein
VKNFARVVRATRAATLARVFTNARFVAVSLREIHQPSGLPSRFHGDVTPSRLRSPHADFFRLTSRISGNKKTEKVMPSPGVNKLVESSA